jgi:hypothetical protein
MFLCGTWGSFLNVSYMVFFWVYVKSSEKKYPSCVKDDTCLYIGY